MSNVGLLIFIGVIIGVAVLGAIIAVIEEVSDASEAIAAEEDNE